MTATATFAIVSNTYYLDEDALERARAVARGRYQRSLLEGSARWSGADLRGAARRYSGHYARSRASLVAALRAAGLHCTWIRAGHGRRVLVVSSAPCQVVATGPYHGPREAVVTGHPDIETGTFAATPPSDRFFGGMSLCG